MNPPHDLNMLLSRIRQGDESALADFLLHYEIPLRRAAHALMTPMLRSHIDSVDVVQSVYRGLLGRLRDGQYALNKPDDFLALALTAIRNKLISKWRRAENEKKMLQSATIAQSCEPIAASNPAELAEQRDLIDRLLRDLNAADRQLVEWQLIGLTPTEMAARLVCDPHALRAKLSRLRQELRRRSDESHHD